MTRQSGFITPCINDSVFHAFNRQGRRSMEYVVDQGQFSDVPEAFFFEHIQTCYPHVFAEDMPTSLRDLQSDSSQG